MKPQISPHPARQLSQVLLATLLVAGTPVGVVWWLRVSGTVDSAGITLAIGVALSLVTSWAGRVVWERHQGSEDLLFSELMVWGYLHRHHAQRRLASASELAAPLHAKPGSAGEARALREQTRLLDRLVSGMETRDPYLHGHSRRVARHSWMIARRMKLGAEEVARVRTAAALHDVGKTKTPKTILHKAGPLTDEEYRIIKLHPAEGADMAAVLGDPELEAMIRYHHERLDGSGYPDGLRAQEIPLGARIIAVADTFDAITSARPYRAASPHRKAIDILHAEAGTRLDPDVVRAFCSHYAGRGPVALWSFLCSVPERLLSWLSASAGAFATAAKVVAVAAIVGGAAATSATLGIASAARPSHLHVSRPAASTTAASHLSRMTAAAPQAGPAFSPGPKRARGGGHARRVAAHTPGSSTVRAATPAAGPVGVPVLAGGAPADAQSGGNSKGTHQEGASGSAGGSEEAKPVEGTRQPVSGEAPRRTHEEAPVKAKREEAPAKGKPEEPVTKGKSEEPVAKGKPEEPVAKGKSEEPSSKGGAGAGKGNAGNGGLGKPEPGAAEAG